jgi:hypothetical protein
MNKQLVFFLFYIAGAQLRLRLRHSELTALHLIATRYC